MLAVDDRRLYSDTLRPPPGWSLDRAVAATYSLDLATLLVFPLHLSLLDAGRKGDDALRDGVSVLESLRRLTDRISIFAQQAQVLAPGVPHMLYSLLEPVIFEVRSPQYARGGQFHAKFWLLRFTGASDDEVMLRLVIPTRNVTTDRCWDLALTLEAKPGGRPIAANRGIRDLVNALPELSCGPVPESRLTSVRTLADEAYRTTWELPGEFDEIRFHALGLRGKGWLPPPSKRLAVISPFLSASALDQLSSTTDEPALLVSRPEDLKRIPKQTLQAFERLRVLSSRTHADDVPEERVGGPQVSGLHAKAYIAECGWDTHLFIGSANATAAGLLGSNIEILAELIGRRSRVSGIDAVIGNDGLGRLLDEYRPPDEPELESEAERAALAALRAAQMELSDAGLRVVCKPQEGDWISELHAAKPMRLAGIENGIAWPATRPTTIAADLLALRSGPIAWSPSSTENVTGLIAFELKAHDCEERLRFTLNLPLEGIAIERREGAILRSVLSNREGFLRYLLLLLADDPLLMSEPPFVGSDVKPAEWLRSGEVAPILEELTRALCRDRGRLRAVAETVKRLQDDEGGQVVPPGFIELWRAFETVMEEAQ